MSLAEAFGRVREAEVRLPVAEPGVAADSTARILTIDIETTPNVAHVWGLFDVTVSLNQIVEVGRVFCFAAKWYGEDEVQFFSDWNDGHEGMVRAAWDLLNEADYVVSYNGRQFDMKHLRREFVLLGLPAPLPWRDVDLLQVVRRQFRFASNKLDFVAQQLGVGGKVKHEGHDLWKLCLEGDRDAWGRMEEYNRGDVVLTEGVFVRLLPWLGSTLNLALYAPDSAGEFAGVTCPACGAHDCLEPAGDVATPQTRFVAYRCSECGSLSRSLDRVVRVKERGLA